MSNINFTRRRLLQSAAAATALGLTGRSYAADNKLLIGYWPIAAGLPFFAALDLGMFKAAGVTVEGVKFGSPNQVAEALIAGRIDGCANGTAITVLGLAEAQSPGLLKFVCLNFADEKYVLDQIIVPIGSNVKTVKELAGKKVACGPGINNVTLTKVMLEHAGAVGAQVVELPIGQLVPALAAGQVDGAYILEPTGVIGRQMGVSRSLGAGVVSRYVLDDPNTPWVGGAAALTATAFKDKAALVPGFLKGYQAGVDYVRKQGLQANVHLKGYTAIDGPVAMEVPISGYITYDQVKPSDVQSIQKLFDVFTEHKVFDRKIVAAPMLYKA